MKVYEGKVAPPGEGKIAIVVAKYNKTVTEKLLEGAVTTLKANGIDDKDITVAWVPGAFEIPTIAQRFALDEDYQAVICLGCVIKGETSHDEHINRAVSLEIARIGVDSGIPVIFGVLTCNNVEQALARSAMVEPGNDKTEGEKIGNKGTEAAEAALEMLDLLIQLPELEFDDEEGPSEDTLFYNAKRYRAGDFDDEDFEDEDDFDEMDVGFPEGVKSEKSWKKDRPSRHGKKPEGFGGKKFSKDSDFRHSGKKGKKKGFSSDRPKKRK